MMIARLLGPLLLVAGSCEGTALTSDPSRVAGEYEAVAGPENPGAGRLSLRLNGSFSLDMAITASGTASLNDPVVIRATGNWRQESASADGCELVELTVLERRTPNLPPTLWVLFHDGVAHLELGACISITFRRVR